MARAIYSLKIMLFKQQFRLTAHEEEGLRQVCLFVVLIYVKAWFLATSAVAAPYHDLKFLQKLLDFKEVDEKTSEAAVKKIANHLWYLTEELIPLSLFDPEVPVEDKSAIVDAMKNTEGSPDRMRRLQAKPKDIPEIAKKTLADLASKKSLTLFERFNMPTSFLSLPPIEWESDEDYQRCVTFFGKLTVVNDVAERGVALTTQYVGHLRDEENTQNLLLVAKDYRQNHSKCDKQSLIKKILNV